MSRFVLSYFGTAAACCRFPSHSPFWDVSANEFGELKQTDHSTHSNIVSEPVSRFQRWSSYLPTSPLAVTRKPYG